MQTIITTAHKVAALIPHGQYAATIEHIEAFEEALIRLEKQLEKCPKLRATDGMKEHPAIFHYFCGATDMYFCEYDGEDTLFGFTILNGDLQNAEWGYTSLAEIPSIPVMNKVMFSFPGLAPGVFTVRSNRYERSNSSKGF
jgi:hypothetical protein